MVLFGNAELVVGFALQTAQGVLAATVHHQQTGLLNRSEVAQR